MRFALLLLLLIYFHPLDACIREYNPAHIARYEPGSLRPFAFEVDVVGLEARLSELSGKMKSDTAFTLKSDYAATLIQLGKWDEAIPSLLQLQQQHPRESNLAANLCMAYDLKGMPDSALYWGELAWELNPKAHTEELIHLEMLRAMKGYTKYDPPAGPFCGFYGSTMKKTQKSSPAWFRVYTAMEDLDKLIRQRIAFARRGDPLLSQLFLEYGLLCRAEELEANAWILFELGRYFADGEVMGARMDAAEKGLHLQRPDMSGFLPGTQSGSADSARMEADFQKRQRDIESRDEARSSIGRARFLIWGGLGLIALMAVAFFLIRLRK